MNYTNIEQSKHLLELGLSPDTADMFYSRRPTGKSEYSTFPDFKPEGRLEVFTKVDLPCWSLAALLHYLNEIKPRVYTPVLFPIEGKWILQFAEHGHGNVCEVSCDNPVDACYEMIVKLHELNLL